MSAALEAVVVRQLAGLRRASWSLGDALDFVQTELPASALKTRLQAALASVRAGAPAASPDLLVATLTRGDAASASVLDQLAEAIEADDEARVSTTTVRAGVTLVLCLCTLVLVRVTGSLVTSFGPMFEEFGGAPPALTQLFFDLAGPITVLAPMLLAAAIVIVWRMRFDGISGGRELRASSLLFQFASAVEAGVTEASALALIDPKAQQLHGSPILRLESTEQAFLRHVMSSSGAAEGARRLALELRTQGGRLATDGRWWLSPGLVVIVLFTAFFVAASVAAMFLPAIPCDFCGPVK